MRSWQHVVRTAMALLAITLAANPATADELDRYVAQERRVYLLPAVVLGVIRDGRLTERRAQGLANVELGVAANTRHAFEIGSISKQFTAYAILILREQGRVELDAPVGRYLPGLPQTWAVVPLHRLLTHTSGLPDLEEAFGYGLYRETPDDDSSLKRIAALPVLFPPGEKWHYSNTNYWLLARVIELQSGLSYADFMQKKVFEPLRMRSTRSALPTRLLAGRAPGYRRVGAVLENRDPIQPHTGRGLGDIVSTLADMARWEREQLAPRLVSPASAALARQPVLLNDGKPEAYGYGWSTEKILPALPVATLSHDGQTAGFTASYIRIPSRRLAVVVFTNAYGAPVDSLAKAALGHADSSLRTPRPRAIADTQQQLTQRAHELLRGGASADRDWREDWFGSDYWAQLRPWLAEVAEFHQRLGTLRSLTLVGREAQADTTRLTYRAVYPTLSRLLTLGFDAQGRITSRDAVDE